MLRSHHRGFGVVLLAVINLHINYYTRREWHISELRYRSRGGDERAVFARAGGESEAVSTELTP